MGCGGRNGRPRRRRARAVAGQAARSRAEPIAGADEGRKEDIKISLCVLRGGMRPIRVPILAPGCMESFLTKGPPTAIDPFPARAACRLPGPNARMAKRPFFCEGAGSARLTIAPAMRGRRRAKRRSQSLCAHRAVRGASRRAVAAFSLRRRAALSSGALVVSQIDCE